MQAKFLEFTVRKIAATKNNWQIVEKLTSNYYLDINASDEKTGKTALHIAAQNDNFFMFRMLILLGAHPAITDKDGKIPAELASKDTQAKFLEFTLWKVAAIGDLKAVEKLAQLARNGLFDINASRKESGNTAMHYAAKYGWFDIFSELAKNGGNANLKNKGSPLREGQEKTSLELVSNENQEKFQKIKL